MAETVLSALSTAFFMVRIVKGPWMRNPQYVAAALTGALVAGLLLNSFSEELEADFIFGSIAGLFGGWLGIFGFDRFLGSAEY